MKKLFSLLLIALLGVFIVSCEDRNEQVDNDTISAVYDLSNANFTYDVNSGIATYAQTFARDLFNSDVVMIYRRVGTSNGNPVWQALPQNIYNIQAGNLTGQELEYTYDFSKRDIAVYASGTFDLRLRPDFLTNQTFRVVIIPGFFGRSATESNDLSKLSYEEVIAKFNINDKNVTSL